MFQEPEKVVEKMLEKIGFVDYDVTCKNSVFVFEDLHVLRSKYYFTFYLNNIVFLLLNGPALELNHA